MNNDITNEINLQDTLSSTSNQIQGNQDDFQTPEQEDSRSMEPPIHAIQAHAVPTGGHVPSPPTPLQPLDLDEYRVVGGGYPGSIKLPSAPCIRKPSKQEWFQAYPDCACWPRFNILIDDEDSSRTAYLVAPPIAALIGPVVSLADMVPCALLNGDVFFWPLKVAEHVSAWNESARQIAAEATKEWRRMAANMSAKRYDAWKPERPLAAPEWPAKEALNELLAAAFTGRVIETEQHPMVLKLLMK